MVDGLGDAGTLTGEPQRFAIVPEWLLDADVSDCAVRLYAVLLRYGQTSGSRMPAERCWPADSGRAPSTPSTEP